MIISVINNKGGVGKSTISINLAHALANKGNKILVIDQDPQANTTSVLSPAVSNPNTLYSIYNNNMPASSCIYPTPYEGVDILPNESRTAALEMELYQDVRTSYFLLRSSIEEVAKNYDFVIIDCPPNLGLWVIMALVASDCAIIPIEAGSRYSIDGFVAAYDAILSASQRVNTSLRFLKAVINKVDLRASISKVAVEHIRRQFGDKVFTSTIPTNTDIQKSEAAGQTVLRFAPQSSGAKRFRALADELLELLGETKQ